MDEEKKEFTFVNEQIVKPPKWKQIVKLFGTFLAGAFITLGVLFVILWSTGKMEVTKQEDTTIPYVTLVSNTTEAEARQEELSATQLNQIVARINWAVVTVACYGKDETAEQISCGIIIQNGDSILILTDYEVAQEKKKLEVTFYNDTTVTARVKKRDSVSQTAILSVPSSDLTDITKAATKEISIGSSTSLSKGVQVIYVGNPIDENRYVDYGMVTSDTRTQVIDGQHRVYYTNIAQAGDANGFLIDTQGNLVGIANNQAIKKNQKVMSFVGINDLTDTIERLSNGIAPPFMGIYGQELTDDIIDSTQAPVTNGIYVQEITGNSPAYNCGVRSGDIIVKMSDADIYTLQDYMTALRKLDVGDVMTLVVYRPESEGYQEYKINVVLEEAEETR